MTSFCRCPACIDDFIDLVDAVQMIDEDIEEILREGDHE